MSQILNKSDLVGIVAKNVNLTKNDAGNAIDSFLNTIFQEMKNGNTVKINNFGIFVIKETKARVARNPRTGEKVEIKASRKGSFKPSSHFKKLID